MPQTAINPTTGERVGWNGSNWVPIPKDYVGPSKEGQVTMGGTGFEDVQPSAKPSLTERVGLAALSLPVLAGGSAAAIPAGAALGGLEGLSERGELSDAAIGAGLGAGGAALPIGVRAGTAALATRMAARPAMTRLIGAGLGAAGGGALGAVGGEQSGHAGYGALGGAAGGAYLGYKLGGGLASAAREAIPPPLSMKIPLRTPRGLMTEEPPVAVPAKPFWQRPGWKRPASGAPGVPTGRSYEQAPSRETFADRITARQAAEGRPTGGGPPLRPLVGSEADWRAYDQQMGILEPEAQTAGMYHAARGSAAKNPNLQQRMLRRLRK